MHKCKFSKNQQTNEEKTVYKIKEKCTKKRANVSIGGIISRPQSRDPHCICKTAERVREDEGEWARFAYSHTVSCLDA